MRSSFARLLRCTALAVLPVLIFALPSSAKPGNPPTIKEGSTGYWVKVAQQDLTDLGYSIPVSGSYTSQMATVVNQFKAQHHLYQDGAVAWPKTWKALEHWVSREQHMPFRHAFMHPNGLVTAAKGTPTVIRRVIAAANHIAFKPYVYGGGHASWKSKGYDCSGSVSYALHGGGLLWYPEDSSELESYGLKGFGKWITIWTNAGHAYMKIAGIWFDTAAQQWGSHHGDRWSTKRVDQASGYVIRHPTDF